MATYVIGDVQGCWQTLRTLLEHIEFDRLRDRLLFLGDLVNRGPGSLEVLRFVSGLGPAGLSVLGNHDLHLLGRAIGSRERRRGDTLGPVLAATDRHRLLDWLRQQPLMHEEGEWILVHAGLLPAWELGEARAAARRLEAQLRGADWRAAVERLQGKVPLEWKGADTAGRDRLALSALTRLRCVDVQGRPAFGYSGPPDRQMGSLRPWYTARPLPPPGRHWLFGHWAAHGFGAVRGGYALDSGCIWGGLLSALRLDDQRVFQVPPARGDQAPRD